MIEPPKYTEDAPICASMEELIFPPQHCSMTVHVFFECLRVRTSFLNDCEVSADDIDQDTRVEFRFNGRMDGWMDG